MRVDIFGQLSESLLHVVILVINTTIDKACAVADEALHVLVVECRFHLTLGIGHLIVFLTFVSGLERIEHGVVEANGVVLLHLACSHLLGHLVAGDDTLLLGHFVDSQVNEFVVGLCLLSVIGQLSKISIDETYGLGIGLGFQD